MGNGSGVSRGDRNRNARLARLRALVPVEQRDRRDRSGRQEADGRGHRSRLEGAGAQDVPVPGVGSGRGVGLGGERAAAKGFAGVTVACEPTGHRWRVLGQLAADAAMPFVCVQPMLTSWARRSEDLTIDKTDEKDAVLIARLTAQLRCYVPEPVDETLGPAAASRRPPRAADHRDRSARSSRCGHLLECVWPAALDDRAAAVPVQHLDRRAERDRRPRRRRPGPHPPPGPGPVRTRGATPDHQAGQAETLPAHRAQAVRRAHRPGRGASRTGPARWNGSGCCSSRLAARPRAARRHRDADDQPCSTSSADRAGHLDPRASRRSAPRRSWPRPATRAASPPPARWSNTPASRRGRNCPAPSSAAPNSPAQAGPGCGWQPGGRSGERNAPTPSTRARYRHLTTREKNKLTATQAQTVIAAAILRQLHAVITTGRAWDPTIATHGTRTAHGPRPSLPDLTRQSSRIKLAVGASPTRH